VDRASGTDGTDRSQQEGIMSNNISSELVPGEPGAYQIRIQGHLGRQWTGWFGGFAITLDPTGDTLLTGRVVDQAALHGLLRKIRDLGITLVSVGPVGTNTLKEKDR
jgi:hypothetical protein